jgi:hypothetical protein
MADIMSRTAAFLSITFYLAHEKEVDTNSREGEENLERGVPPLSQSRPELYARLPGTCRELAKH